jgi:uncharacterized protein Veg
VWAIGRLAQRDKRQKEPSYHHTYTRRHTTIEFGRKEAKNECLPFVQRKPGLLIIYQLFTSCIKNYSNQSYSYQDIKKLYLYLENVKYVLLFNHFQVSKLLS